MSPYMYLSISLDKPTLVHIGILCILQSGSLGTMPNLRSLRLNIDGKVSDFNLATLLNGNPALETLHIHLIGDAIRGVGHGVEVQGSGTALRHELQDNLPKRLKNIVIQGPKIENIHPAAFKVWTNYFVTYANKPDKLDRITAVLNCTRPAPRKRGL